MPNHQTLFLNDDDNIKNYYSIRPENSYPLTTFRRNRVTPYLIFHHDDTHIVYALTNNKQNNFIDNKVWLDVNSASISLKCMGFHMKMSWPFSIYKFLDTNAKK